MKPVAQIDTLPLFPKIHEELIALLKSLLPSDWEKPTVCSKWCVKDIAAHLWDGNLRRVVLHRDGYFSKDVPEIKSSADLLAFLNQLNADWVQACKRLSPEVLIEQLDQSGKQMIAEFERLDMEAQAAFAVSWAGDTVSPNWFDIAREYTEKWHHQQQIRLAVGKPGIMSKALYLPFLDTFMRGLPHTYRNVDASDQTCLQVTVPEVEGSWFLQRVEGKWMLLSETDMEPKAKVKVPAEIAWRLFSKGISREEALGVSIISGDEELAMPLFSMVSVMA
ncbi:maleylpyruvate isomerase family mycothiol-dependent enzyme [Flammeovirgaceae bacterium SG7u.111]|nr:maleylpyruvate isomerase family mycothiol-dependent enzyme [Flammeovirgaceae bacterium SG7u.132]WPO34294.1 maleylpyruvate isomerase family mycothiol-dependent enzyme [Flammeovirgaceae bacterium SG7u.111]